MKWVMVMVLGWLTIGSPAMAQVRMMDNGFKIKPAPSLVLKSLNKGTISLSKYKGKVIILNYFATWCPPCRREFPDLIALQKAYPHQVQVVALSLDDTVDPVRSFIKSANFPVVWVGDDRSALVGPIRGIPTTYVIDSHFVLAYMKSGYVTSDELKQLVTRFSAR